MACEDDVSVPGDLKLYRRINPKVHLVPDENPGKCCRVSSGAFRDKNLSIYLHDTLAEAGLAPQQLLTATEPYLVSVTAEQMRNCGQIVCREPDPEDEVHGDFHGEVVGSKGSSSKRNSLLRECVWEVRPDQGCEPPCGSLAR